MNALRCKPGDMAIVHCLLGGFGNGKMVTCVRLSLADPKLGKPWSSLLGPVWEVDTPLPWMNSLTFETYDFPYCPDKYLVPIRGGLTEDELRREADTFDNQDIGIKQDPMSLRINFY